MPVFEDLVNLFKDIVPEELDNSKKNEVKKGLTYSWCYSFWSEVKPEGRCLRADPLAYTNV